MNTYLVKAAEELSSLSIFVGQFVYKFILLNL